jgi:hypothetical protein
MIALACALTAACTTTNTKVAKTVTTPDAGARILLVKPDVELSILLASGVNEPRADWSNTVRENLSREIQEQLGGKSHSFTAFDPEGAMGGRGGQVLRLNEVVGQSIQVFDYGALKLPTHADGFDWTLGDGAIAFGQSNNADYALFVLARGSWASEGRQALAVGAALLGAGIPMGSQALSASLVDLKTGRVVWYNIVHAGSGADMRAEGADELVKALLKDAPL